ncbi:MAG: phytanoyl-CoA dioxygenase family protein [Chitinophagales bacterium]|nr:phytanoyl-CoA dioxygenase family protein [Chitinophagales bacterium]MDW8417812.1 phytanoyl-CoA dioxygenase family protein [Chitinophagales bacterium]
MKTARFIDPAVQESYEENGYVLLRNVLNRDEITQLRLLFEQHYPREGWPSTMWNSLCDIPHDVSANLSDQILKIVKPRLDEHITNYVCPAATFLVKNPNEKSTVTLHRDFSVQDEPEFSYQNIWLPIVDTTPENGQLYVLRKSHKFFDYPLPHNTVWPYLEYEPMLLKYCDVIDAKAGDLVVYGDKVLHGSPDNRSKHPRPVVHFGLLHPEAKLYYYYHSPSDNMVTVYEVPYTFFFENAWGNQDHRFPIYKKFSYSPPLLTQQQIIQWLEKEVHKSELHPVL